jgi:hypothetical protein
LEKVEVSDRQILHSYKLNCFPGLTKWAFWGLVENAREAQERAGISPSDYRLIVWVEEPCGDDGAILLCIANPGDIPEDTAYLTDRLQLRRYQSDAEDYSRGAGLSIIKEILSMAFDGTLEINAVNRDGKKLFCVKLLLPKPIGNAEMADAARGTC